MNPRSSIGVTFITLLTLTACQQHEFQTLTPVTFRQTASSVKVAARQSKPNLMLVIDKSQSMSFPIAESGVGPSRWDELKDAFSQYLTNSGTIARMGLMTFPSDFACGGGQVVIPLWEQNDNPSDLQNHANLINTTLANTTPGGVTPTLKSLEAFLTYAPLQTGGDNIIVLATDGLPNCNPDNPNSYDVDPAACDCNFAPSMCGGANARLGCLDRSGTVGVVRKLKAIGIKTAVVGIGADTLNGVGPQVMNAIASEGGAPRSCPQGTDAECGNNNSCNTTTKVCDMRYYQANSSSELASALTAIGSHLGVGDFCAYTLDSPPADSQRLSVIYKGQPLAEGPDGWSYQNGVVTFQGSSCNELRNSTSSDPVNIEFRALEIL